MSNYPPCPKCQSVYTYEDREVLVCPECANEWRDGVDEIAEETPTKAQDANGNDLFQGDNATLIKDLKVKGSSETLKIGTRIKINHIVDGDHNIDCRIGKSGAMMLKSEFVKKSHA